MGRLWKLIPVTVSGVMRKVVLFTFYMTVRKLVVFSLYTARSPSLLGKFSSETGLTPVIMPVPQGLNDLGESRLGINSEPRQSDGQDGHRIFGLTFSILQVTE